MTPTHPTRNFLITLGLTLLIFCGIAYRFAWMDWNQGTNLHPDEYGLTNTLTQLHIPDSLAAYFNTRLSPLSPYQKYNIAGQVTADGPDNRMRWGQWPMIIIRGMAELTGNTGYDALRMMGRYISALIDSLTVLLIFLIGRRLYNHWVGLLGAALTALAVMQIQESHFMTVDNYSVFFAALTMYIAVRIALRYANAQRNPDQIDWRGVGWYALFGISFGMTLTSKVNLLPLGGMLLVAAFVSIAYAKPAGQKALRETLISTILLMLIAGLATLLTIRVTQPMSFRAPSGDTTFWTLHLNQDWVDSMKVASQESNGIGGGPPSEQWADRPIIVFPLMNMVVWGMGIPLGVAAWAGFLWAAGQILTRRPGWLAHLLPVIWVGGFFIFMATRWVKSIRYFLPIYPFLCLLAAWGLVQLFVIAAKTANRSPLARASAPGTAPGTAAPGTAARNGGPHARPTRWAGYAAAGILSAVVICGTLVWATAFVDAVYRTPHTRIQATRWILANVPGPFHIQLAVNGKPAYIPIAAPDGLEISQGAAFQQSFQVRDTGKLVAITLPHVRNTSGAPVPLTITLSAGPQGSPVLDQATIQVPPTAAARGIEVQASFQGAQLTAGQTYVMTAGTTAPAALVVFRNIIANENWDEGLPVPLDGYNPFGEFYQGVTMPVRWTDDEDKRKAYISNLANVDYIILPSQRSIWSICRLPLMYPMTIEYYRALFDGRLGFQQAALFQAPWKIGPLEISDVGGTLAWGAAPSLPRFNFNFFATEEAFSVYDHPPVWIFKKEPGFSMAQAQSILEGVDLSKAVFQAPVDTRVVVIK